MVEEGRKRAGDFCEGAVVESKREEGLSVVLVEERRERAGGFFEGAKVDSECEEGLLMIGGFLRCMVKGIETQFVRWKEMGARN